MSATLGKYEDTWTIVIPAYQATVADNAHITASYLQATTNAITVFAHWTPHEYTMSFDPNEGNCTTESIVGIVDAEIDTLPEATRDYYDWDGWYTAKTGGSRIDVGFVHDTDSDITAYAHWTPHTYTMTFDVNIEDASCDLMEKQGTVDSSIGTLPTPTKQYYTFNGWFTDGTGGTRVTDAYVQGTDQPISVYAQWTPGTYTMTFNKNGGACSTTSKTGTVDAAIGILPSATKELYSFKGWFTSASGGTKITESYVQSTTSNITVYAQWDALPYTMVFNGNGNSAFPVTVPSPSTRTYYADTPVGSLPTPTRSYHTFDGWYTAATGGNKITTTYAHPSTNPITVYAHWTPYTFSLSLNPGGGSCSETVRTCSVGVAIGTLPTPTRTGYTFKGWYDAANNGNKVEATKVYMTNSAAAVFAQWTANEYTYSVVYKSANGTSLGSSSVTKTFGTTNTITPPAYSGYTTPAAQNVTWDATSKTITFTYGIASVTSATTSGTFTTSPQITYTTETSYRNRTATSVEICVKWTLTIHGKGKTVMQNAIHFWGTCGSVSIPNTKITSWNEWQGPYAAGVNKTKSATSSWVTVPLTTTNQTTLSLSMELWQCNANGTKLTGNTHKTGLPLTVNIPAY